MRLYNLLRFLKNHHSLKVYSKVPVKKLWKWKIHLKITTRSSKYHPTNSDLPASTLVGVLSCNFMRKWSGRTRLYLSHLIPRQPPCFFVVFFKYCLLRKILSFLKESYTESCVIRKPLGVGFYIEYLSVLTRGTTEAVFKRILSLTPCYILSLK